MTKDKANPLLIVLAFLSFIGIGLPDGLLGVAWPSMRESFGLPLDALGGLLVMYTTGYLISSFGSGWLLRQTNVGVVLSSSCLATGISLIGYASVGRWWMVILSGAVTGLGAGAIDAGLNTFAAMRFSTRTINWLHAFYGIGAFSGPLMMTGVLSAGHPWQQGYAIAGAGQLLLAGCFGLTQHQWNRHQPATEEKLVTMPELTGSVISLIRLPVVWCSVTIFFVYTGIEATAGVWVYSLFTEARAISMMTAGTWMSIYWGALTVGRILSAMVVGQITTRWLLRGCIAGQALGAMLLWLNLSSSSSFSGLALIGLASAPVFPTLIATTPERISQQYIARIIGFQIAAAVLGQSLLPALAGLLARTFGLELIAPALLTAALLLFGLHEVLLTTPHLPKLKSVRV